MCLAHMLRENKKATRPQFLTLKNRYVCHRQPNRLQFTFRQSNWPRLRSLSLRNGRKFGLKFVMKKVGMMHTLFLTLFLFAQACQPAEPKKKDTSETSPESPKMQAGEQIPQNNNGNVNPSPIGAQPVVQNSNTPQSCTGKQATAKAIRCCAVKHYGTNENPASACSTQNPQNSKCWKDDIRVYLESLNNDATCSANAIARPPDPPVRTEVVNSPNPAPHQNQNSTIAGEEPVPTVPVLAKPVPTIAATVNCKYLVDGNVVNIPFFLAGSCKNQEFETTKWEGCEWGTLGSCSCWASTIRWETMSETNCQKKGGTF